MADDARVGVRLKRKKLTWAHVWPALVAFGVLLVAWELTSRYGGWQYGVFPGPLKVLDSLSTLIGTGYLWPSVWITLQRLFIGFGISIAVGGLVAFTMARFVVVRRAIKPYLLGFQSLPSIAWVPLSIVWMGYSERALIFVTIIGSVFAVAIAFTDALVGIRPSHLLAARNMGSKGGGLILRVMIPAALPALVSGAKQCWSFAWRSLVGAEIIFATLGLGFLLESGRTFGDTPQVMAVMIATLTLGVAFEVFAFARIERWVRRRYGLGSA
jgi:NitT/TauT family transport system permease protein